MPSPDVDVQNAHVFSVENPIPASNPVHRAASFTGTTPSEYRDAESVVAVQSCVQEEATVAPVGESTGFVVASYLTVVPGIVPLYADSPSESATSGHVFAHVMGAEPGPHWERAAVAATALAEEYTNSPPDSDVVVGAAEGLRVVGTCVGSGVGGAGVTLRHPHTTPTPVVPSAHANPEVKPYHCVFSVLP